MRRGIVIDLNRQRLWALEDGRVYLDAAVSTAVNGPGEREGSGCTPRGLHEIRERIGDEARLNTVFVGRRPTGEIYVPELAALHPERDWILTRILWLSGLEPGRNLGGDVDTFRRYIYIHGCPDETPLGNIGSHGCVRMRNADLLNLFSWTRAGERVLIVEDSDAIEDEAIRSVIAGSGAPR